MTDKSSGIALDAFRELYVTLYDAIAQPNLTHRLAARLYQRLLITRETRDAVHHTTGVSPGQQAALLLRAAEASIQMDHRRLRSFVRVLRRESSLKPVAEALRQRYSEFSCIRPVMRLGGYQCTKVINGVRISWVYFQVKCQIT